MLEIIFVVYNFIQDTIEKFINSMYNLIRKILFIIISKGIIKKLFSIKFFLILKISDMVLIILDITYSMLDCLK